MHNLSSLSLSVTLGARPADLGRLMVSGHGGPDGPVVTVTGELDMATAPDLDRALRRVEHVPGLLTVLLAPTFADSRGLAPAVEVSRRRRRPGSPGPVRLRLLTPAAGRVFTALRVDVEPGVDTASWDRFDEPAHPTTAAQVVTGPVSC